MLETNNETWEREKDRERDRKKGTTSTYQIKMNQCAVYTT